MYQLESLAFPCKSSENGKILFMANCASCHAKNIKDKSTGPALYGVESRWAEYPKSDLYNFIRNSKSMIDKGHPRATQLWEEYKPTNMTNFKLSNKEIDDILEYVK
jgi:mono/diheme cytochrome c family protein